MKLTNANNMLADSLRAGDIVDINIAGEWKERYGIVNEVKETTESVFRKVVVRTKIL